MGYKLTKIIINICDVYVHACVTAWGCGRGQRCGMGLSCLCMDSRNRAQDIRVCFYLLSQVPPPR